MSGSAGGLLGILPDGGEIEDFAARLFGLRERGAPVGPFDRQATTAALLQAGAALSAAGGWHPVGQAPTPMQAISAALAGGAQAGQASRAGQMQEMLARQEMAARQRELQRQAVQQQWLMSMVSGGAAPNGTGGGAFPEPPGGAAPIAGAGEAPLSRVAAALPGIESGNNPGAMNAQGFAGATQLGAALARDAGLYRPAEGENLRANQWRGRWTIPGFPEMTTRDYLANPAAQRAATMQALRHAERDLDRRGLAEFVGREINGVPVTREGLLMGAWLGGAGGVNSWLRSGGRYDPADANGTRISDYVRRGATLPAGTAPEAPQMTAGGPGGPAGGGVAAPLPNALPASPQAAGVASGPGGLAGMFSPQEAAALLMLPPQAQAQAIAQRIGAQASGAGQPAVRVPVGQEAAHGLPPAPPGQQYVIPNGGRGTPTLIGERATSPDDIEMIGKLSAQFRAAEPVKDWLSAARELDQALISGTQGTPQGDLALVIGFAKALDPTSVVRESEIEMARARATVGAQVNGFYQRVVNGETLTAGERRNLRGEIARRREAMQRDARTEARRIIRLAQRNAVDPTLVVEPDLFPFAYDEPAGGGRSAPPPGGPPAGGGSSPSGPPAAGTPARPEGGLTPAFLGALTDDEFRALATRPDLSAEDREAIEAEAGRRIRAFAG